MIGSDDLWGGVNKDLKSAETCFSNAIVDSARREIKFRIDSGKKKPTARCKQSGALPDGHDPRRIHSVAGNARLFELAILV